MRIKEIALNVGAFIAGLVGGYPLILCIYIYFKIKNREDDFWRIWGCA